MVMDARDIIDAMPVNLKLGLNTKKLYNEEKPQTDNFTESETLLLNLIGSESKTIDDLALQTGMEISEIAGVLFNLEINSAVYCSDGKYSKNRF